MKLTIVRLENFSDQDKIDLGKIWPEYSASSLSVDETHRIYAARFNERLLGAVRVTLSGTQGALDSLRVRDITRRRGVGQYLIEEVIRENPDVSSWWMADVGVEDRSVMAAFMQALGFTAQEWLGKKIKKPDGADAYPAYMLGAKNKKPPRNFPRISRCRKAASYEVPGSLHK